MDSFSRRQGYERPKVIQFESMDDDLRIGLWNKLTECFWCHHEESANEYYLNGRRFGRQPLKGIIDRLWTRHLKRALDRVPTEWEDIYDEIRSYYFSCMWHEVYDFIEYMVPEAKEYAEAYPKLFISYCNEIMAKENSAYRFVGGAIAPLTNQVEIAQIEEVLQSPYDAVREQIASALVKLSDKIHPDYRNCIKESIGAVETATRMATGDSKGTLSKLLKILKDKHDLHPALAEGFEKLYGYTSDSKDGIRHAMMDKPNLTADDARYMLVSCSAFANYLLRLAERAEILIPPK